MVENLLLMCDIQAVGVSPCGGNKGPTVSQSCLRSGTFLLQERRATIQRTEPMRPGLKATLAATAKLDCLEARRILVDCLWRGAARGSEGPRLQCHNAEIEIEQNILPGWRLHATVQHNVTGANTHRGKKSHKREKYARHFSTCLNSQPARPSVCKNEEVNHEHKKVFCADWVPEEGSHCLFQDCRWLTQHSGEC